jgi:multidrug efflux pump subunit AcrA (membrane-fusion protein)
LRTLSPGTEIRVRLPALGEERTVKIKRIAPTIDARTRTIGIVAELDNKGHRLKAGMLAEVLLGAEREQTAAGQPRAPSNGQPTAQAPAPDDSNEEQAQ